MRKEEMYDNLCKKCYIKLERPSQKDIKHIVLSEEQAKCENCGRNSFVIEYVDLDY